MPAGTEPRAVDLQQASLECELQKKHLIRRDVAAVQVCPLHRAATSDSVDRPIDVSAAARVLNDVSNAPGGSLFRDTQIGFGLTGDFYAMLVHVHGATEAEYGLAVALQCLNARRDVIGGEKIVV
jgi:hypothetical protein